MARASISSRWARSAAIRTAAISTSAMLVVMLAACAPSATMPAPTQAASRTPTATPTPTAIPERVIDGTAGQNRPYVEYIIGRLVSLNSQPASLEIIDTLVAGGFDRAAMEVTDDTTRVGSRADSILFSILIDGECLLGQVADGAVATSLGEVLGTGRCLVGRTVSLD